jgi:hypothetical protein
MCNRESEKEGRCDGVLKFKRNNCMAKLGREKSKH